MAVSTSQSLAEHRDSFLRPCRGDSCASFGNLLNHVHMSIQLCGCCFPYRNQVQTRHEYFCCVTQQAKSPLSLIVILKQFIIKYEHFVQGQLHFTKPKIVQQQQKNCWSLIYNMNYSLKSCFHKSQIYNKKRKSILG